MYTNGYLQCNIELKKNLHKNLNYEFLKHLKYLETIILIKIHQYMTGNLDEMMNIFINFLPLLKRVEINMEFSQL